ncbi:hypothetical protein OC861_001912 [Tilletia horrida]|nr:hypothetical protein OC845_001648 [Tilletia horrida]KAK0568431.1 hypothetical protein OC861_001912 [Tilletia horrida]
MEVILLIIANVVEDPRRIYSSSHGVTKTLLSCIRVCRATRLAASNLLRQHCVYIDDHEQLQQLIQYLEQEGQIASDGRGPRYKSITQLYLSPFGEDINDLSIASAIERLFKLVHQTLRRLVIDIPLRSIYPEDDEGGVRRPLRDGFSLLTKLEEFVSVRDELYLNVSERVPSREAKVWTMWPDLRRLALYNPVSDPQLWQMVRAMPHLATLVLTRADGLESCDMKAEYLHVQTSFHGSSPRPLRVLIVNTFRFHSITSLMGEGDWLSIDPDETMHVSLNDVPVSPGTEDWAIEMCQEWIKQAALKGILWDCQGRRIRGGRAD